MDQKEELGDWRTSQQRRERGGWQGQSQQSGLLAAPLHSPTPGPRGSRRPAPMAALSRAPLRGSQPGKCFEAAASGAQPPPTSSEHPPPHATPRHATNTPRTRHGRTHSEDSISIDIAVPLRVQAPLSTQPVAQHRATLPAAALRHFHSARV